MPTCAAEARARNAASGSGEEEGNGGGLIALGIVIGLTASVAINVGQNLESEWGVRGSGGRPALATLGKAIFISAAVANFGAFALAPASVLSPLEGAQFVANLGYGVIRRNNDVLWNLSDGEKPTLRPYFYRALAGTLVVCVGVALPVIGSSSTVAKFDTQAIECFLGSTAWWIWAATVTCIAIVMRVVLRFRKKKDGAKDVDRVNLALFAVSSAVVGGFAVVSAKAISELLEVLFTDVDDFANGRWLYFVSFVVLVVGFFAIWLWQLKVGPERYNQTGIIPALQGGYIVFASVSSLIFFEEADTMSDSGLVLFFAGLALIVVGVFFIVPTANMQRRNPPLFPDKAIGKVFGDRLGKGRRDALGYEKDLAIVRDAGDADLAVSNIGGMFAPVVLFAVPGGGCVTESAPLLSRPELPLLP